MANLDAYLEDVAAKSTMDAHVANTSNPHGVTKAQVGLGNVDNTSDANKPISTATQTALDGKVDENVAITGATKTKVTYDAKGLVTAGADATTADIADSTNKRYVTDAQQTVLGSTSGTNTGDETAQRIGDLVNGATEKTTPVDADMVGLMDSAASNILKKLSWANIKATLKTYFDTLYFGRNTSTLSGDFTTNSATYTDITGLTVTLDANSKYMVWITTPYSSPATATGVGVSMTVTGSPTLRNVTRTQWTNTTVINSSNFGADDAGSIGATVGTAGQVYGCTFLCTFVTAASSCVIQMRAARGGTSNTISIKEGATIVAVKIA